MIEQQPSEFYGVDVSDWGIIPLKSQELNQELQSRYTPQRGYIFSQALQNGITSLNVKSMQRTLRRNTKKLSEAFQNAKNYYLAQSTKKIRAKKCQKLLYALEIAKLSIKPDELKKLARNNYRKPSNNIQQKKNKTFKIMSPEAIAIKCAKRAYQRKLQQKQLEMFRIYEQKKQVLTYFQKKKIKQNQRRKQRVLLIKAFKWPLFQLFGTIIFRRRWCIGRQQLLDALELQPEQIDHEYLAKFIEERQSSRPSRGQRFVRRVYNYPFRSLHTTIFNQFDRKKQNQKKYERRMKKAGRYFKGKKIKELRSHKQFYDQKQRVNKKVLDNLALSNMSQQLLLKRQQSQDRKAQQIHVDELSTTLPPP